MNTDRVDFIAEYCDRWCERCPFTMRCSAFALSAAMSMCDDHEEAFELALGRPRSAYGKEQILPAWKQELPNVKPSAADDQEIDREFEETRRRVRRAPLMMLADNFSWAAATWLRANRDAVFAFADPATEACVVAGIRGELLRNFPDAEKFVRPGFDTMTASSAEDSEV